MGVLLILTPPNIALTDLISLRNAQLCLSSCTFLTQCYYAELQMCRRKRENARKDQVMPHKAIRIPGSGVNVDFLDSAEVCLAGLTSSPIPLAQVFFANLHFNPRTDTWIFLC